MERETGVAAINARSNPAELAALVMEKLAIAPRANGDADA